MAEDKEEEKKIFGAKTLSKIAMAAAGLWIIIGVVLKGCKVIDLTVVDIVISGFGAAAVWVPTYASIYLDKIKDIKEAGFEH